MITIIIIISVAHCMLSLVQSSLLAFTEANTHLNVEFRPEE